MLPELAATVDRDPTKVWTTEEVLAIAFARPPNLPPGTAYEYNNTNYMLLGLIAEKVDGKPLDRAMQDRLFGPLGMHNTILHPRASNTIPDPYSHGYLYRRFLICPDGHAVPARNSSRGTRRHALCPLTTRT